MYKVNRLLSGVCGSGALFPIRYYKYESLRIPIEQKTYQ